MSHLQKLERPQAMWLQARGTGRNTLAFPFFLPSNSLLQSHWLKPAGSVPQAASIRPPELLTNWRSTGGSQEPLCRSHSLLEQLTELRKSLFQAYWFTERIQMNGQMEGAQRVRFPSVPRAGASVPRDLGVCYLSGMEGDVPISETCSLFLINLEVLQIHPHPWGIYGDPISRCD